MRKLGLYLIGFVVCVVIPAFITTVAPVSRLSLERHGDSVSARTHILLFLLVPFRREVIDPVMEIDERRGRIVTEELRGERSVTRVRALGFLVIHGTDQTIEIPVSPAKLEHVRHQAQAFLADPHATELKMTLVTDWLISAGGGLFSVLTVFYVIGMAVGIGRSFLGIFGPPSRANGHRD